MHYMSGGQFNVPIVIRGPGRAGAPAGRAALAVDGELLLPRARAKVVRPSTPEDAKGLLKSAIRDDNPVIFIEAETLYTVKGEVPEDPEFTIPLGQAVVRARAPTSPSSRTWA